MRIAVVGGGPAGLRAAEVAADAGAAVTLFDAKPSVGRKLLVAGRGGLNLTKMEPLDRFAEQFRGRDQPADLWRSIVAGFGPDALRQWAAGLGVETFVASTGRVYPRDLKAAPLLRRWIGRLRERGVRFEVRHRWTGIRVGAPLRLEFSANEQSRVFETDAAVLGLGGGSWPETGSDGTWTSLLARLGVEVAPLQPANCGWEVAWPSCVLDVAEGKPLKNIVVRAGAAKAAGELLVTRYGLEGGAIYQLGATLREMAEPEIAIDFKPSVTVPQLVAKMGPIRRNFLAEAQQRWRLNDQTVAILKNVIAEQRVDDAETLGRLVKACPLRLLGPRPLPEVISSAGGVRWSELNASLMLKRLPGIFVAGEMIDWEAPTGGYLIHGCLATGALAAQGAVAWCERGLLDGRR